MDPSQATHLTPLALVIVVLSALFTLGAPRRSAVLPLLAVACYLPLGQAVVFLGLHFWLIRLLLAVCIGRVILRREYRGFSWTALDRAFLLWVAATLVCGILNRPTRAYFINRLGYVYNALAAYFFVRIVVRDWGDVVHSARFLALLMLPLAALMVVEKQTGQNVFSVFGGVPELTIERDGRLRCQGAFQHPILAGTFGATNLPILMGLWSQGARFRRRAGVGVLSAVVMIVTSASSGPLLVTLAALLGLMLWKQRRRLRVVRWGIVLAIAALAAVMKAPVWYVTAHLSKITGGTGWYRAWLIDTTLKHMREWWLCGTAHTADWGVFPVSKAGAVVDPDHIDITNQFVLEAITGGLLKLGLFVLIIVLAFRGIGRQMRPESASSIAHLRMLWSLGVALAAHCMAFLSVTYFDQVIVFWYWLLAVIASLTLCCRSTDTATESMLGRCSPK